MGCVTKTRPPHIDPDPDPDTTPTPADTSEPVVDSGEPPRDTGDSGVTEDLLDCDPDTGYPVTWSGWANGFFINYCRSCHSEITPDRQGAPVGVDFDTAQQVEDQAASIWRTVIDDERMPVGGGVYPDDLLLLAQYLCLIGD